MEQPAAIENRTHPDTTVLQRILAILDVALMFAAVHVTYRSIQAFTAYGRWEVSEGINFISGTTMIVMTLGVLYIRQSDFGTYGLSLTNWKVDLRVGLTWFFFAAVVGGILAFVFDVHGSFSGRNPPSLRIGLTTLAIKIAVAILFATAYRRKLPNEPRRFGVVVLASLFWFLAISPLPAAIYADAPLFPAILDLLWMGIVAGLGEELYFRGYIQSRVNETWGRPWKLLGVRFGVGLIISSLLFGFIHALNSVDYFHGQFSFAWGYAFMTIGLLAAVIRERTGTIWPCVVMHMLGNILGRTAALLAGVT